MKRLDLALLSGYLPRSRCSRAARFARLVAPGREARDALRDAALTMPHFVQRPVHSDRSRSWMDPAYGVKGAKKKSELLYVGDDSTNDVFVYDYKSGAQVGQLTGFDGPYGMCVDAKGDVYVANFDNGTTTEYAHGGTTASTPIMPAANRSAVP